MARNKFALTTTIPAERGNVWFPIETDLSIEELLETLRRDGVVLVDKLEGRRWADKTMTVERRAPTIIGRYGVATITDLHIQLRDGHPAGGAAS